MSGSGPQRKRLGSFGGFDAYALAGDELHLVEHVEEAEGKQLLQQLIELEQDPQTPTAPVQMGPYSTYLVVAAIQLACSHPRVQGPMAEHLEQLARKLQGLFGGRTYELLEQGWHRDHDRDQDQAEGGG